MSKEARMLLEGTIAELVIKLEPKLYRKYTCKSENNKPMLYVKLKKAIWGTVGCIVILEAIIGY